MCKVLDGFMLWVNPEDMALAECLAKDGFWESWITLHLLRWLQPGMRCLNLGANVGYYAMVMADRVGPTGAVLAVEPHAGLAELVKRSARQNGYRMNVLTTAVGARLEIARLIVRYEGNGQWNLGGATLYPQWSIGTSDHQYAVPVDTVDHLAKGQHIDFMLMDVEGAERDVWFGMQDTLQRNPHAAICMEIAPGRQYDCAQFLREIRATGYPIRLLDTDSEIKGVPDEQISGRAPDDWVTLWLERE